MKGVLLMSLKDKSEENERAAKFAAKKECYNVAISRYYYAIFQRMLFYLQNKGIDLNMFKTETNSHNNLKNEFFSVFNAQYDKKDKDNIRTSINYFVTLKTYRVKADYYDEYIDKEEYQNTLKNDILKLLNNLKKIT